MSGLSVRSAILVAITVFASAVHVLSAAAAEMTADEAKRFIGGKLFAYNCFEGTSGAGRIYDDGSVVGSIQIRGDGPVRYVALPAGTLRVKGESYCASMRGLPFEPCFNVNKTSHQSFRGSVYGLPFAYCEFTRRSARVDLAGTPLRLNPIQSTGSINRSKTVETADRNN
jgi:hypothetical protein